MTLDQLRYFCEAAQLGTFSKAAQAIHISQPSLCAALHKLEEELQVCLFEHNRRGAVLTEAGRSFLQDARLILHNVDLALAHVQQYAEKGAAQIRIAYTSTFADSYVPAMLKGFLAQEAGRCSIYSDEMPSDQIAQGLRDGQFDLGLCSTVPTDASLVQTPILYQELCLITPENEPDTSIYDTPQALNARPLICYRQDYPMYRLLCERFAALGVSPDIIHYAYSESSIAHLVEQGLGVAVIAQADCIAAARVRLLKPAWLQGGRYLYLTAHRTRILNEAAERLRSYILAAAALPPN